MPYTLDYHDARCPGLWSPINEVAMPTSGPLAPVEPLADPRIVPRTRWGAKPPRGGMALAGYPMRELWVHHSYTWLQANPLADARLLQEIAFSRGFVDTSYTFLLHPDGTILEGRDIRFVGGHTYGRNGFSLGVCLIGNYQPGEPVDALEVTEAQVESFRWLRHKLVADGYLLPGTYPTGGHRDNPSDPGATSCPGNNAYRRIAEMQADEPEPPPEEDDMPYSETVMLDLDLNGLHMAEVPVPPPNGSGGVKYGDVHVSFAADRQCKLRIVYHDGTGAGRGHRDETYDTSAGVNIVHLAGGWREGAEQLRAGDHSVRVVLVEPAQLRLGVLLEVDKHAG